MMTFQKGDHVCHPCASGVYHHMIVLKVHDDGSINVLDFTVEAIKETLDIVDRDSGSFKSFRKVSPVSVSASDDTVPPDQPPHISDAMLPGIVQFRTLRNEEMVDLVKVAYGCDFWTYCTSKVGTATTARADSVDTVLKRAGYVLAHPHVILPYSLTSSNCETLACWCKTGRWATLQVLSALVTLCGTAAAAGAGAYSLALLTLARTQTVTVAAAGLWGWFGYKETKIVRVPPNPLLLTTIGAVSSSSVGLSAAWTAHVLRKLSNMDEKMNELFASRDPAQDEVPFASWDPAQDEVV